LRKIDYHVATWTKAQNKDQKISEPTVKQNAQNDNTKKNIPKYITLNDYLLELKKKTLGQRFNILIEIIKKNSISS